MSQQSSSYSKMLWLKELKTFEKLRNIAIKGFGFLLKLKILFYKFEDPRYLTE